MSKITRKIACACAKCTAKRDAIISARQRAAARKAWKTIRAAAAA